MAPCEPKVTVTRRNAVSQSQLKSETSCNQTLFSISRALKAHPLVQKSYLLLLVISKQRFQPIVLNPRLGNPWLTSFWILG